MSDSSPEPSENIHPLLHLIRDVHAGKVDPRKLPIEQRQRIVAHLSQEGVGVAELAVMLHFDERTIERDRRAIREAQAIEINPQFTRELAGDLLCYVESAIVRIRRIARDSSVPTAQRLNAEDKCVRMKRDVLTTLIRAGIARADDLGPEAKSILAELFPPAGRRRNPR